MKKTVLGIEARVGPAGVAADVSPLIIPPQKVGADARRLLRRQDLKYENHPG
jgi:hypothetical protein